MPPPILKWSTHYGGLAADSGANEHENGIYSRITTRINLDCQLDTRLRDAAREYSRLLAVSDSEVRDSDIDQLRFLLAQKGSSDYLIQPFVAGMDGKSFEDLLTLIETHRKSWTHCGLGIYRDGRAGRIVFLGVRRLVSLEPFPVSTLPGSRQPLRGRVEGHVSKEVHPFVGRPDGSVERLRPASVATDGTFETMFFFRERGKYEVELVVEGERGAETAVLVPVFAGIQPDAFPTVVAELASSAEPRTGCRAAHFANALARYLTEFRSRHGLPPLNRDKRLDALAKSHSDEMAEKDYFGHISPALGTLAKRFESRGLRPARFAENVARSGSLYRIHRNLMKSPSHRINAINPVFSHVGIGVAEDGSDLIATQVFARF